jgi:hypothetical protein
MMQDSDVIALLKNGRPVKEVALKSGWTEGMVRAIGRKEGIIGRVEHKQLVKSLNPFSNCVID